MIGFLIALVISTVLVVGFGFDSTIEGILAVASWLLGAIIGGTVGHFVGLIIDRLRVRAELVRRAKDALDRPPPGRREDGHP